MELLDLPPEIFQRIIHFLVTEVRPWGAWKYRQVCRVFASEIYHNVFTNQPMAAFQTGPEKGLLHKDLSLYLFNRTKNLLDANDFLPTKILKLADYLIEAIDTLTISSKDEVTKKLCDHVLMFDSEWEWVPWIRVLSIGKDVCIEYFGRDVDLQLSVRDKLAAASAIGNQNLIRSLLSQSTENLCQRSFPLGSPLARLVQNRHHGLLKISLKYLNRLIPNQYNKNIVLNEVDKLIDLAISRKDIGSSKPLIEWRRKHGAYEILYRVWLTACVTNDDASTAKFILSIPWPSTPVVTYNTFACACSWNSAHTIKELLSTNDIRLDSKYETSYVSRYHSEKASISGTGCSRSGLQWPLETATLRGNTEVVRSVLEAGTHSKEVLLICEGRARKKRDVEMHELLRKVLKEQEGIDIKPYKPRKPLRKR